MGDFENGIVSYNPGNYFGSILTYQCNPGYTLIGNNVRICEGDSWWSGSSPVCVKEVFCDRPPELTNALPNIQLTNEIKFKSGTEVEYQCEVGYKSNGESNRIICQETDGQWSQLKLNCTSKFLYSYISLALFFFFKIIN